MGKTLISYFKDFDARDIAQFYIHSEIPTSNICKNYYSVTDKEMIKSILGYRTGTIYNENNIDLNRKSSRIDTGTDAKLYQKARKRTPLIYLLRNLWWKIGHWNNKKFKNWLDEFNPECVFLASGDYSFIYNIALKIAKSRNIPLYVSCMDDYYFYNKNENKLFGKFQHRIFMKSVHKTMNYASKIFCICESMSKDYTTLFKKECITIHTGASFEEKLIVEKKNKISYIGNLSLNRYLQLVDIGRTIKGLNLDIDHIDVYSGETRQEILEHMIPKNGIVFHGSISADEVKEVMAESLAVIHTESFDKDIENLVRYSVSTKIADSLMSGTCILAYGPSNVASIKYLLDNNAAYCICLKSELNDKLRDFLKNQSLREEIIENALVLALKNHKPTKNHDLIKDILTIP